MNELQQPGSLRAGLFLLYMLPSLIVPTVAQAQEAPLRITNASEASEVVSGEASGDVNSSNGTALENLGTINDLQNLIPVSLSNFRMVAEATAQESQAQEAPVDDEVGENEALRIPARFGAGFTTSGGGFGDHGRIEGFIPLWQEPGEEIGFLEGRLVLDEGDDVGFSLLFDYRGYNEEATRIRGGYVGFDVRGTGNDTFYQLGTGYESLGDEWDFRFNAYLPVGDRTEVVRDDIVNGEFQTSSGFVGNELVLTSQRETRRIRETEIVLGGFDAEAGYRIAEWNEGEGDLTAFGGLYLLSSPETPTYLGWRLRLFSNFTPNFNGGLTLQDDGLFGTRLVATVGATFPGNRPESRPIPEEDRVRARLGESIVRLPEIALFVDEDVDVSFEEQSSPLINPGTEDSSSDEPYRFLHVDLGATGGDGTFENPFGTVQEALNTTAGDGNDVVYVNGETDVLIPGFEIPDQVRVLSQGPTQTLAGRPFPGFESDSVRLPFAPDLTTDENVIEVELPLSGDGSFPRVENVTLGDRTILAGFQINDATGDAISGTNISTAELRNNTINNATGNGIALNNVGGSVIIFDQFISNSGQAGIFAENTTTDRALELSVIGFELEGNNVGMDFSTLSSGGTTGTPSQTVAIEASNSTLNTSSGTVSGTTPSNSIVNSTNQGLIVESEGTALTTSSSQIISFSGGTITGSGSDGVQVTANQGAGAQEFTLTDSIVSNNNGVGVFVRNGLGSTTAYTQEIFVRDSQILDNAASGIDVGLSSFGSQEINVIGSDILRNGGDGIRSFVEGNGLQEFPFEDDGGDGITGNTISGNAGQAINSEVRDNATLAVFNVRDNDLSGNGVGPDIDVEATATTTRSCVQITGNTAPSGISLTSVSNGPADQALFQVLDLNNVSFNNNNTTVALAPDPSAFTDLGANEFCLQD